VVARDDVEIERARTRERNDVGTRRRGEPRREGDDVETEKRSPEGERTRGGIVVLVGSGARRRDDARV
jgi:hypothetical protein